MTIFPHLQIHTSELNDGYDWGRLNLQSVTEQTSMDDFLATAELAGTEFVAGISNTSLRSCVVLGLSCMYIVSKDCQ